MIKYKKKVKNRLSRLNKLESMVIKTEFSGTSTIIKNKSILTRKSLKRKKFLKAREKQKIMILNLKNTNYFS